MTTLEATASEVQEFIALRRELHRYPELAFEEHRTADLVASKLAAWGYQVHRGLGGTGVVGTLKRGTCGSSGKRLGLRADMDALPITETSGRPWASLCAGRMHACGHDGHTAMLLAAAHRLSQHPGLDGTLHLIFQPAEEAGGGGGAQRMIDEGLFDRFPCDALFAMHNMPGIAQGHLHLRSGPMMASGDEVTIELKAPGGHGAMPHCTPDPIVAAAHLVTALQTVVARNVNPQHTAVVTVGYFQAGQAYNVIPPKATLGLTVRAGDREVRRLLHERIEALAHAQAESFGVKAEVTWKPGYPVLVNDATQTDFAHATALSLLGPDRVVCPASALMASEDFAFMLEQVPGCYLFIGNGDGSDGNAASACMVHNPNYDFNDDNIAVGAAYWVHLAERFLKSAGVPS
jgi:hippurate hydrolase